MRSKEENKFFFDDLVKMAGGALNAMGDAREQIKSMVKERMDDILEDMNLVTRGEFERVEAIAEKALQKQAALEKRLAALEKSAQKKGKKS